MLRIRVDDDSDATTLYVEGKLAGETVNELRRVWASVRSESPGKQTVIDLSSVRVVDCVGRKLLCQMHGWGTRLAGNGLMIGPLIEEIISSSPCDDPEKGS
jgi:anti-anti-sigma regulatory factor